YLLRDRLLTRPVLPAYMQDRRGDLARGLLFSGPCLGAGRVLVVCHGFPFLTPGVSCHAVTIYSLGVVTFAWRQSFRAPARDRRLGTLKREPEAIRAWVSRALRLAVCG